MNAIMKKELFNKNIIYDIFKDFGSWQTIADQADINYRNKQDSNFCSNIKYNSKNDNQLKYICSMFVILFEVSLWYCSSISKNIKDTKYPELLNYWLNFKLTEEGYKESNISNLFEYIRSNYDTFKARDILNNKIYYMDNHFFYNIHIIYKLYEIYDKLKEDKHSYYNTFLKEIKSQYNYGLEKCFHSGDINFCEALKKFRNHYKDTISSFKHYCHGNICPFLPDLNLDSSSHNERLRIAKLGNELMGGSFIPSLKGPSEVYTGEYFNLKYLIFLQYNLHMVEDNDKNNYVMVKILYEFIQYCIENKKNRKLLPFMKEFIGEYYDKKKPQYKTIFDECRRRGNTKEYCNFYKTWKEEIINDLTMIETNTSNYFEKQENYINNLSGFDLLLLDAKEMFQEFKKMSKYTPTIMSTIVAILIGLFFLYKVLINYI
ncbi:hypothetical protein PVMG_02545 [Plasmodium vivax Mauritania I]|uniref:Variable surface protein n=1 Tax=Plasmodium vivax Mauritania I TaxID=1035515 RepID=A0A0J9TI03_PLAVI|nr:hypothetical protein PVMG_02545 [Plasmodium vivax Mauritania I]